MKNIILAALATFTLGTAPLNAQENKKTTTESKTILVAGNCGMCKKRIENAAYIPGVKRAEWDKTTKELKVVYNGKKTSLSRIEENIAKAGHDAGETKATEKDYKKLPDCCAYGEVGAH
ncbi:MAG: metal transporter [Sphingobacteriales bacterium]|nr:MAG: metal transporter [Sphingobacteriales bacterium]